MLQYLGEKLATPKKGTRQTSSGRGWAIERSRGRAFGIEQKTKTYKK